MCNNRNMQKLILVMLVLFTQKVNAQLSVNNPKAEYKTNPIGIESTSPSLSWEIKSNGRGILQTAYRILVADKPELLEKNVGNVWDSKKINSSTSIQIKYKGLKLISAKQYYWKVMCWDNKNNVSGWSPQAFWGMGLLTSTDWKGAKWICYENLPDKQKILPGQAGKGEKGIEVPKEMLPIFRKSFFINKQITKATVFVSGLGQFELSINGKKMGDHILDPGWTQYDKETLYVQFDVSQNLVQGNNVIGMMLGNGFYFTPAEPYRKLTTVFGFPKMLCRLFVEYKDGSSQNIISDDSWKTAMSPITFSSVYGGETYNANIEQPGWNEEKFDDKLWKQALIVEGSPKLKSQMAEPVKVFEIFLPQKITKVKDSAYVFDLAQNASGIPSIIIHGKKGDTIKIIPGELLNPNGTVTQKNIGGPFYFQYVLKSNKPESWQPRFSYGGFRYLQVEGAVAMGEHNPAKLPQVMELKSLHIRNAAPTLGEFNCSGELFNRTFKLIDWSVKSNMQSIFTDCPHREKLGWLEQDHLMASSILYNYDVINLLKKTVYDMMQAQTSEGLVPEIAPEFVKFNFNGNDMFRDSPEWGSAAIILPWYLYQWYGEKDLLKEAYPMMKRYIEYLKSKAKDNIISHGLGDWYDLGPKPPGISQLTPKGVTATAIYYYDVTIMREVEKVLLIFHATDGYGILASAIKKSFNQKFFNDNTKQYAMGSQTANAMAVYMKLVEPENKNAVIENIVKDLRANKNALTAGDIGYRYLLRVLEDAGRSDVIFDMNSRTNVPGYGYQLSKGATSLTESWQALPTVSNNHLMLGHLMEWFYRGLCGIRQNEYSIAFKNIEIDPQPVGDIIWANANYQSPYGLISSSWKKQNNRFELDVEIPANTTATIFLPSKKLSSIKEGGKAIEKINDFRFAGFENGKLKLKVGSGAYKFLVK